ncbi:hypothetical protein ACFQJ7_09300 [Halovenus rubra]|uniref:Uncharacterized protein n=2 Tax=Halovenus rubra TaxID=869890 RepID=A0ABD5XBB5_9EURY|nr:hypothetical protein [Halovenus rubra]
MPDDKPEPPSMLPSTVVEAVDDLNEAELRAIIDYVHDRQEFLHTAVADQIEAAPGEEIIRIEERPGHTKVLKREPCGEKCQDCPHGPYLYHVREEARPDGETHLQWHYLGHSEE